jgi:hypothetical protein
VKVTEDRIDNHICFICFYGMRIGNHRGNTFSTEGFG